MREAVEATNDRFAEHLDLLGVEVDRDFICDEIIIDFI
jgi:hypothetical protein